MPRLWAWVRWMSAALWGAARFDAAMHEEMRFHVDMETERLMREQGLDFREARRQAQVAFGGVEKYKEKGRDIRGLQWIDAVSLDARLGVRMLLKHRGLTVVGAFAMAVAIAIGATFFEVITEVLNPALPVEDGARVVALRYATETPGNAERRLWRDFVTLRQEMTAVEQLGAFRTAQHNLVARDGSPGPIRVAEMTASGFAVTRTPPLVGRYLLPGDERDGAPPVVVIGHQAWQSRFGGDPQVVGRTINLDGIPTTVVGIMPEGFEFPVDHQFWIPLRLKLLEDERFRGPELSMFGRLAGGVTMEQAQAELTTIALRAGAAHRDTHARLRPAVLPYTHEPLGITDPGRMWLLRIALLLVGSLSFVVAVNIAILVYARTVTRLGEIAVRTALGASRRRILAQLFTEALALSLVGAGVGLVLAHVALRRMASLVPSNGSLPFWIHLELSVGTIAYGIGLAILAAAIVGVVPGLKATGRGLEGTLRALNGRTGTRLGPMWTTLVVAQLAVAVAVLPWAVYMAWQVVRMEVAGPGFAADEFVVATVAAVDEPAAAEANSAQRWYVELTSRLAEEPGVSAVTFSSSVPGFAPGRRIQFDDSAGVDDRASPEVSTLDVGLGMFDVYGAQMLEGHAFSTADLGAANAVIVNRTFERKFLQARSALGVRFRYAARMEPGVQAPRKWYQIVGVIRDFPSFPPQPGSDGEPTVYHPAAASDIYPVVLSVRFNGGIPDGFVDRFRAIGAEVDPALQLRRVVVLSEFYDQVRAFWRYLAWGIGLVTASVIMLSAAGIYALMSFTVVQRAREIAIRAALGAAPHRLVMNIFRRAAWQLTLGLLVGSVFSAAVFQNIELGFGRVAVLVLTVAAMMLIVGLLSAVGPARRGLRIQPSEALRSDG